MLLQFIITAKSAAEIEAQARRALEAGIIWIEICAPDSVDDASLKETLEKLRPEMAEKDAVLIIGDRYEAAKEWQVDGTHIYTQDNPISAIRRAVEAWPIIGVSVNGLDEATRLNGLDIDYLYFNSDGTPEALETIRSIARYLDENAIETPLVAGGDITEANLQAHVEAGAAAVATSDPDNLQELQHQAANSTQINV